MEKVTNYITRHYLLACFIGGAILGSVFFILIYGFCPLDVQNVAYLINERRDLPAVYLTAEAYRNAGWENGIGKFNTLCYPNTTSLGLADLVPLLGFFFKLISPVLPDTFQYMGWWGLICFFLQGGFAALIIRKFTKSNIASIFFSIPFVLASPVLTKLFYHHAEAGQWILLMVFAFWLYHIDQSDISRHEYVVWGLVGVLTTGVCIYFIPMVGMILVGYCINHILNDKKNWLPAIISIISFLLGCIILLLAFQSFGSFVADESYYSEYIDRLRRCGANLNAFINSWGIAFFGRHMDVAKDGQGEGLAYLGMGMIIAAVVACACKSVLLFSERGERNRDELKKRNMEIALCVVFILSIIVGIGPTLSFNARVIGEIPYPNFLLKMWCSFRSTGRMIWPAYYIIYIFIFKILSDFCQSRNNISRYFNIVLLGFCCIIQILDLYPYLEGKHDYFAHYQQLETTIHDEAWKVLGEKYSHMVVLPNSLLNRSDERYDLAKVAIDNHLTINDFYFARQNLVDQTPGYQERFMQGVFDEDTFYVIPYSYLQSFLDYNLHYYMLDQYIIATEEDISSLINKREIEKNALKQVFTSRDGYIYKNIDFSPVFDPIYYYYSYSDLWAYELVDTDKIFTHFISIGMQEGRRANQAFSPAVYKRKNDDISAALGEDWGGYYWHYLEYGIEENRQGS